MKTRAELIAMTDQELEAYEKAYLPYGLRKLHLKTRSID